MPDEKTEMQRLGYAWFTFTISGLVAGLFSWFVLLHETSTSIALALLLAIGVGVTIGCIAARSARIRRLAGLIVWWWPF